MVTREDIKKAALELGIRSGDAVLVHSSFKSFGGVEGGAESVVGGFMDAIGEEGTLVFPTLCKDDWEHIFENWHMDAESYVGYLTNYFRKLPGAIRSNQATHSVAAMGKDAEYITKTHGESGLRYGIYGDAAFAADSPWEKLYQRNAKVVFIGCDMNKCTFRHLIEYKYVDKCLAMLEGTDYYDEAKSKIWCYGMAEEGAWPLTNGEHIRKVLDKENKPTYTTCGNAKIMCVEAKVFVDKGLEMLEKNDWFVLASMEPLYIHKYLDWKEKFDKYIEQNQK